MRDPQRHLEEMTSGSSEPVNSDQIVPHESPTKILHFPRRNAKPLLRTDWFRALLVLTLANAAIFLHYARTKQQSLPLKHANVILETDLGRQHEFLAPVSDIMRNYARYTSAQDENFAGAVGRFRGKLTAMGIETRGVFEKSDFASANGGAYWAGRSKPPPLLFPKASEVELP